MFTVYVLYSAKFNKIYIGYTSDLNNRIISHNTLATKGWTIKFKPWSIIYTEVFSSKTEALKRERELKSAKGREFVKSINQNNFLRRIQIRQLADGSSNCCPLHLNH